MKELWYGIKKKAIQKRIFALHGFLLLLLPIAWLFGITPFIICVAISLFIIEISIRKFTLKINLSENGITMKRAVIWFFKETIFFDFQNFWIRFYSDDSIKGEQRLYQIAVFNYSGRMQLKVKDCLNDWVQFLDELISIFEDNGWKKVVDIEKEILGVKGESYYYQHPSTLSNDNTSENDS
ncbi:hypothetical protein KAU32_03765 [bacterium]|nr:hypothetical protein [bacterium]